MIKNNKAQSQIVSTVLIILLVLAAIAIVWQVVNSIMSDKEEDILSVRDCMDIVMEVRNPVDLTGGPDPSIVVVRRNGGIDADADVMVVANGEALGTVDTNLGKFDSTTIDLDDEFSSWVALSPGEQIDIIPILPGGVTCDVVTSYTVK